MANILRNSRIMSEKYKKLFKVERMGIIANRSLNLYSLAILSINICVFDITEQC